MNYESINDSNPIVSVHDGFPNPATDTSLQTLDLNQLLITHPLSTYMMRIVGNDWRNEGIFDGDIAVIDRALKPRPNDLVVWWKDDIFVISRFHQVPENAVCFGIITSIIHQYREKA